MKPGKIALLVAAASCTLSASANQPENYVHADSLDTVRTHHLLRLSAKKDNGVRFAVRPELMVGDSRYVRSRAATHLQRILSNQGMTYGGQFSLKHLQNAPGKPVVATYKQTLDNIDIAGQHITLLMNQSLELLATSGEALNLPKSSQGFQLSDVQVVGKALQDLKLDSQTLQPDGSQGAYRLVTVEGLSQPVRVKSVWYPLKKKLEPAYQLEVLYHDVQTRQLEGVKYTISAVDGTILLRKNLSNRIAHSYRTFADVAYPHIPFDSPAGSDLSPLPGNEFFDLSTTEQGVFVEPEIAQSLINLEAGPITNPSQHPWISDAASQSSHCYSLPVGQHGTCGNNVVAYVDLGADGYDVADGDVLVSTSQNGEFDYVFSADTSSTSTENQAAAVVNLFYTINWMHDWFYEAGFDEASGNAQISNYARGGLEGDPILAEAQDRTDVEDGIIQENNANMLTPSDGGKPRMQMYLWDGIISSTFSLSGVTGLTDPEHLNSSFGLESFDITGSLVQAEDAATGTRYDACETLTNAAALSGKIALVERGSCLFTEKAQKVKAAGAIGMVAYNNEDAGPIVMGGDDAVDIPAVMVSRSDGLAIRQAAQNGTVSAHLTREENKRDGTLDNSIVIHEWAHYLSNRLVNDGDGLYNQQGGSMGEGWSDFVALMTLVREGDDIDGIYPTGAYAVVGQNLGYGLERDDANRLAYSYGLRRLPYSADFAVNALTFKHIEEGIALPAGNKPQYGSNGNGNSEVHASGEVWAVTLWQGFVALVNEYGLNAAQQRMKDYLVAGLKLTPAIPTFTEARDAMLMAAKSVSELDYQLLAEAFASRGMGVTAQSPDRFDDLHTGVVEDFDAFAVALQPTQVDIDYSTSACDADMSLDIGETATLSVTLKNIGNLDYSGLQLTLEPIDGLSYPDGASVSIPVIASGSATTVSVPVTLDAMQSAEQTTQTIRYSLSGDPQLKSIDGPELVVSINVDVVQQAAQPDWRDRAATLIDWQTQSTYADELSTALWHLTDTTIDGVTYASWVASDIPAQGSQSLTSPVMNVAANGAFSFSFWHKYDFEATTDENGEVTVAYDAGMLQVRTDNGAWQTVAQAGGSLDLGYLSLAVEDGAPVVGGNLAYSGSQEWVKETLRFPAGVVNGKEIQIRFVIGTDSYVGDKGWTIAEPQVTGLAEGTFSTSVLDNESCGFVAPQITISGPQRVDEKTASGEPSVITLNANVVDTDSSDFTYHWSFSGALDVQGTSDQASVNILAPDVAGEYVFTAMVEVSDGQFVVTESYEVTVVGGNEAPTITSTSTSKTVTSGSTTTLLADIYDPNGDAMTVQWTQISGPTAVLTKQSETNLKVTAPTVTQRSTVTIQAVVSDGQLQSSPLTFTVNVNPRVTTTPSSSGGGGGIGAGLVLLVAAGIIGRRRKTH
ncbi:M36 family metallopeptidase [Bowmanella sp. JS7-9]|uniref:M36 family metallopeptidase n=2 Tax=Pseudobowmanella zhangzhouensis TaxID=1537679 RepID=A0ABW1XL14_9ALTE|nr:M36 family metallopeptidase [Bowmanella sp. JS7-9]TBX25762.1 hypothetical protein TK45_03495 [Bowmanella sp. JS7-9]